MNNNIMGSRLNSFFHTLSSGRLLPVLVGLLFFASFYYQVNIGGTVAYMPHTWATWSLAVVIILAGIFRLSIADKIVLPRFWAGLLALPAGLLIAGLVVEITRPVDWALRIGSALGGFLFLFALFQFRPNRNAIHSILFILVVASLGHAAVALLQLYGGTWWHGWFPKVTGVPLGIFQQVNLVASFSATGLIVAAYLLTVPGYNSRPLAYRVTLHVAIIICIAIVIATGSRAGLLGLVAGLLFLLVARYGIFFRKKRSLALMVSALLLGLAYGFHLSDGMSKMENKLERSGYEESRVAMYQISWELFREKPLFGHGLGSFQRVFQEARIPFQQRHPEAETSARMFSHPHNELLFWLVESGLVSVLGMLALVIVTIGQLFRLGRERGLAYLGLISPISLHVMVEMPFYLSAIHWFSWLILLYLIHSHAAITCRNRLSLFARRAIPAVSVAVMLLLILFFVNMLHSLKDLQKFVVSGELSHLESVNENPVLHETGAMFTLRTLLYADVANGGHVNARRYIQWAENYVIEVPNPLVMADLALAYGYLEDTENAKKVINRALSIYDNQLLVNYSQEIDKRSLVDYFKREILKQ